VSDLATVVHRLGDAYRFVLIEAELRDDLSAAERAVLRALVVESATRVDGWAQEEARRVDVDVAPLTDVVRDAGSAPGTASRRLVRRAVRHALAPAWAGVVGWLVTALVLWTAEPARARGDGVYVLVVVVGVTLSGALVVGAHLRRAFTAQLGSSSGSLTTRARTVGAHAEAVVRAAAGTHLGALSSLGAPRGPSLLLLDLRAHAHRHVLRVHAAALAAGVLLFLGFMHALGLL
jgi:hypothetical protein